MPMQRGRGSGIKCLTFRILVEYKKDLRMEDEECRRFGYNATPKILQSSDKMHSSLFSIAYIFLRNLTLITKSWFPFYLLAFIYLL